TPGARRLLGRRQKTLKLSQLLRPLIPKPMVEQPTLGVEATRPPDPLFAVPPQQLVSWDPIVAQGCYKARRHQANRTVDDALAPLNTSPNVRRIFERQAADSLHEGGKPLDKPAWRVEKEHGCEVMGELVRDNLGIRAQSGYRNQDGRLAQAGNEVASRVEQVAIAAFFQVVRKEEVRGQSALAMGAGADLVVVARKLSEARGGGCGDDANPTGENDRLGGERSQLDRAGLFLPFDQPSPDPPPQVHPP